MSSFKQISSAISILNSFLVVWKNEPKLKTTMNINNILYHYRSSVKVGEIERYVITYNLYQGDEVPSEVILDSLWVKIKNIEPITYRAAYLMGPYTLYCDVRSDTYHHSQKLFISADKPKYEPNLQPQQDFTVELSLHNLKNKYVWIVDVISQIIFTSNTQVSFEISIASSKDSLKGDIDSNTFISSFEPKLTVNRFDTLDLWNFPRENIDVGNKPEHLVILTHGLHSNVTADLYYLKEQIEKSQKNFENEILNVEGFTGNVCKTEKGIKYLGARLAEYIVNQLYNQRVIKISFIGHSLGGLVQTFAIAYISINYPWFFEKVIPINFITLASPLLGIVTDNPAYIKMLLSAGIVGKTGQDLGLDVSSKTNPLLYMLPGPTCKNVLRKFKYRTVYANATNDGIVPLYTSSLLFLNYDEVLKNLKSNHDYLQNKGIINSNNFISKNVIYPLSKAIGTWPSLKSYANDISKIPKVSVINSAVSVLNPPLPDEAYIIDPQTRHDIILHDKIYTERDLPYKESSKFDSIDNSISLSKTFTISCLSDYKKIEEEIARKWHEGLIWRKVIVSLKSDAHNNIIVRRRFSNAYGWPVIDHLIKNHFHNQTTQKASENLPKFNTLHEDLTWITKPHVDSVFDVGPAGMISTFGELLESLKNNTLSAQSEISEDQSHLQKNNLPSDINNLFDY